MPDEESPDQQMHQNEPLLHDQASETAQLTLSNHAEGGCSHEHKKPPLSKKQKAALVCDGITHSASTAGTLVALVDAVAPNPLSFWARVGLHAASFGAGALGSLADVRNEADALRSQNSEKSS